LYQYCSKPFVVQQNNMPCKLEFNYFDYLGRTSSKICVQGDKLAVGLLYDLIQSNIKDREYDKVYSNIFHKINGVKSTSITNIFNYQPLQSVTTKSIAIANDSFIKSECEAESYIQSFLDFSFNQTLPDNTPKQLQRINKSAVDYERSVS